MRGVVLGSGLFVMAQLAGACATGTTDADVGADDDDGGETTGDIASSSVGRMPMTASQSGAGGASTTVSTGSMTSTTGGMGGATTTTTASTTTTTTTAASTTTGGCTPVDVVSDGGYEQGVSTPAWALSSITFGSPVCDVAGCGMGGGTGPRSGTFWAWFGGTGASSEIATASQTFVIPTGGMATLDFWLEIPVCDSVLDIFEVTMDGQLIYATDGADLACGTVGYQLESIDVSAFADGGQHTLQFKGDTVALFFGATNFMVDDVALIACQ